MDREINKKKLKKELPLFFKILYPFVVICSILILISWFLFYNNVKKGIIRFIKNEASLVSEDILREFKTNYSDPVIWDLTFLASSTQLNNYLMSSKNELIIHRAELEKLFLKITQGKNNILSLRFISASGDEKVNIQKNARKRTYASLKDIGENDGFGKKINNLFINLKDKKKGTINYMGPFYDERSRLSILTGIAIQEPEAGGFGGVIAYHCDLTDFIQQIAKIKIMNTPVMWVYRGNGENILSPANEIKSDSISLFSDKKRMPAIISITKRIVGSNEGPLFTVVCNVPKEVLSRELFPVIFTTMIIFSIILILSLICSMIISEIISKPIKKLTLITEQISSGNLDVELDLTLIEKNDETGKLARAFVKMKGALKKSYADLADTIIALQKSRNQLRKIIKKLQQQILDRKKVEKKLRLSEEKFRSLVETTNDFIWEIDKNSVYTYASPNVRNILGYEPESIIGKTPFDFMTNDESTRIFEIFGNIAQRGEAFCGLENINVHKDGRSIVIETNGVPIFDETGEHVGFRGIDRDITGRKQIEQTLKNALMKSQESDHLKTAFLANISHELRTPLNPILAFTDLMLDDELSEEHRDYLQTMKDSVNLLLSIINNILDLSKIEAGHVEIEQIPVSIESIFKNINSTYKVLISHKGKDIALRESLPNNISKSIITDPTILQQIMNNLINNAFKFTDSGFIEYGVSLKEENTMEFYVRDTGIGIPEDKQEEVFSPNFLSSLKLSQKKKIRINKIK